jgi:hypothetical protein
LHVRGEVPERRAPALRQELDLLDRALEKLYAFPEDVSRIRRVWE